jgi:hypothetical protein
MSELAVHLGAMAGSCIGLLAAFEAATGHHQQPALAAQPATRGRQGGVVTYQLQRRAPGGAWFPVTARLTSAAQGTRMQQVAILWKNLACTCG